MFFQDRMRSCYTPIKGRTEQRQAGTEVPACFLLMPDKVLPISQTCSKLTVIEPIRSRQSNAIKKRPKENKDNEKRESCSPPHGGEPF
jgi:hypothetical protein